MNNFYLIFIELSATAYGRDIIHIYLLYMFRVVTVIILFCKHWGSHTAFNFLVFGCKCVLPPGDNPIAVKYIISNHIIFFEGLKMTR